MTSKPDPLAPGVFAAMLRHGRGMALMHILEYGLDGVEQLVLQACLSNQVYDTQCEPERSAWLYRMFKAAPQYQRFSAEITAALAQATEHDDLAQLCNLAAQMGLDGDAGAAAMLRHVVSGQDFSADDRPFGCAALVMLDGLPALADMGRRFGALLMADARSFVDGPDALMEGFDEQPGLLAELERLATQDPALAAYVAHYRRELAGRGKGPQADYRQAHRESTRKQYPIDAILAAAEAGRGKHPTFYRAFGMHATDEELETIFQRLIVATAPAICLRLLWVFTKVALPRLDGRIFELAEHADRQMRIAAYTALSHTCDPAVKRLAHLKLDDDAFSASDFAVLDLFAKNLSDGDDELILSQIERLTLNDFEMHRFVCQLVDICEEGDSATVAALGAWAYQATPCSVCRKQVVERLHRIARLPAAFGSECAFDANPDLHALGAAYGAA